MTPLTKLAPGLAPKLASLGLALALLVSICDASMAQQPSSDAPQQPAKAAPKQPATGAPRPKPAADTPKPAAATTKPAAAATKPAAAATATPAPESSTLLPGSSSHEPINIAADKLDYFDKEQKLIYTGNVVAVQGDSRINATVLTIYLDKKPTGPGAAPAPAPSGPGASGGSQVRRMEGQGPVAVTSKDQVGTGDALVYDKPENKFYLIGHVALSQGENVTRGDKLVYDLTSGQAVVSSTGRVRSLIIPGDQNAKPGTAQPAPQPASPAAPQAASPTKNGR